MHLPAALSSVSLHRRHTAADGFEQETALCPAHCTPHTCVRLWRVCFCCCHAVAHFVSTATALLLLVARQQAFLLQQLLEVTAATTMHDPLAGLGCSPSTWRPSGTCPVSLCARTTTTAWAQRSGGLRSLQHSTHAGITCLVGSAVPHRHPCGTCRWQHCMPMSLACCAAFLRQSAVAFSMHHWHSGS